MSERIYPKQEAIDFLHWISNHALRNNLAVLAVIWDREKNSPAILAIENAHKHETDEFGGFSRRFAHTVLSQDDLYDAITIMAVEIAATGKRKGRQEPIERGAEH